MNQNSQHLDDLRAIRKIMEESTRFLSISGSAGVLMGLIAMAGAVAAQLIIPSDLIKGDGYGESIAGYPGGQRILLLLLADAALVLLLAFSVALIFSVRKAKRHGARLWSPASRRVLVNLAVPLAAGGVFVLLSIGRVPGYVSAALTLVFYGLALINVSKFTFSQIYWLGAAEIVTGLVLLVFPGYSLWFWAFGFGVLHIAYGLFMHFRYRE